MLDINHDFRQEFDFIDVFIYFFFLVHVSVLWDNWYSGSAFIEISIALTFLLLLFSRDFDWSDKQLRVTYLVYILFFSWLLFITFVHSSLSESLYAFRKSPLRGILLFFTVVMFISSRKKNDKLLLGFGMIFLLVLSVSGAIVPWLFGEGLPLYKGKLNIFGEWHNKTAWKLNIVIAYSLAGFFLLRRSWLRVILGCFVFCSFGLVFLTLSRAGTISLGLILTIFSVGLLSREKRSVFQWAFLSAIPIVAVSLLYVFRDRIIERFESANWVSLTGRTTKIWPRVWEYILEYPWFGYGHRQFNKVIDHWSPHAHNEFLQIWFETGMIGLLLFLLLIGTGLYFNWMKLFEENGPFYTSLASVCVLISAVIVHGSIVWIDYHWVSLIFALSLAPIWQERLSNDGEL